MSEHFEPVDLEYLAENAPSRREAEEDYQASQADWEDFWASPDSFSDDHPKRAIAEIVGTDPWAEEVDQG